LHISLFISPYIRISLAIQVTYLPLTLDNDFSPVIFVNDDVISIADIVNIFIVSLPAHKYIITLTARYTISSVTTQEEILTLPAFENITAILTYQDIVSFAAI